MITVNLINTPTEINDESLKQYLADCASVVRGVQPKDNDRLFARLIKEGFGDTPSRMFEFIPCVLGMGDFMLSLNQADQHFGFFSKKDEAYYTNARELLSVGVSWNDVIRVVDFTHYRAVHVVAPYFLYGQASTHTQITSVSHSNRYTESGLGYWKPSEVTLAQIDWDLYVGRTSPRELQDTLRRYGITRREVSARGSDMLQYREFTLGGYLNNPNAWPHFINQRAKDPHTQREMRELASNIEGVLK